ncbi:HAD family hydrolase [Thermococcus sp.]
MLVLVDLDDTLCNTWDAGRRAMLQLIPVLLRRRKLKAFFYIATARYRELEQSKELHIMDFDKILERVLSKVYREISREELVEMVELVDRMFFSELRLFPDAIPFLKGIKALGVNLVLITDSSSKWQRKKLEYLGIRKYFDGIIISGETGHSKLEPYNFRLAKRLFPDEEVYMVGDRDDTDMVGGKSINATTIMVRRGYFQSRHSRHADYIVGSLREALEVIRREHQKRA